MIDKAHQQLARAWARLDWAEALARQAAHGEAEPSLWLLAANSILRARDALEAIHPAAADAGGVAYRSSRSATVASVSPARRRWGSGSASTGGPHRFGRGRGPAARWTSSRVASSGRGTAPIA